MKHASWILALSLVTLLAGSAQALPALQLGPGSVGTWTYEGSTQTWVVTEDEFELLAFANATKADGGNRNYAWDPAGSTTQTAYLVVSAVPRSTLDGFDILIENDGAQISLLDAAFGVPPVADPNSISPHGIFSTYFEVYEFEFDGSLTGISDTQPGKTGTGQGYSEALGITILDLTTDAIHFDLFTLTDDGIYDLLGGGGELKRVAPYSHDAQTGVVPEPNSAVLFLVGAFVILRSVSRRRD